MGTTSNKFLFILIVLAVCTPARLWARTFRVLQGACFNDSVSIYSAFYLKSGLGAGDTILLPGGTYTGKFRIDIHGEPGRPVVIRSVPGETAVLQRSITLSEFCHDLMMMDIEITGDSLAMPYRVSMNKGSTAHDIVNEDGITAGARPTSNIKLVNLVIHDVPGDGIGLWSRAVNCEAYGNIIYHNGWDAPDRGHGHGIYTQNDTGVKTLSDNICFNNMGGMGIKVYTETGRIRNFYLEGNVHFGNTTVLLGGYRPLVNLTLKDNYMGEGSKMALGYVPDSPNINLTATGNYLMNTKVSRWRQIRFTNNKLFGDFGFNYNGTRDFSDYYIDSNSYFQTGNLTWMGKNTSFEELQKLGYEKAGNRSVTKPNTNEIFVRPNKYEQGRAHIIVYNWERKATVEVDLTGVLQIGDEFEIRDVQNLHGCTVLEGKFTGKKLKVPLNLNEIDHRVGYFKDCHHPELINDTHTSPEFGIYLVRKKNRTE